MVVYITGHLMRVEALLMLLPTCCALVYRENPTPFAVPIAALLICGSILCLLRPKNTRLTARDGFVTVALSWIVLSLFGMLPFIISGSITSPADAFFETVSGFTTTGSSILNDIEILPRGILFWRSFTNWIGGMGVLVFMLALLPQSDIRDSRMVHVMRAEVPGPKVGKLVSSLKHTAIIMYMLYIGLTLVQLVLLLFRVDFYNAVLVSFSTAGTGGFSNMNNSIAAYSSIYVEVVTTVFMILFGINFNLFYLVITGKLLQALKSEELICYLTIYAAATLTVALNIMKICGGFASALRYAAFQSASIMSTTGFVTADITTWPALSQAVLLLLMFIGGCAGSTGGGLKVGRLIILLKSAFREIRYVIQPRTVRTVRFEGKTVENDVVRGTGNYFVIYMLVLVVSTIAVSAIEKTDVVTDFTAVVSCLNNIGPGLGTLGMGNFSAFSGLTKLILSADMLLGRLEIYPFLILFSGSAGRER